MKEASIANFLSVGNNTIVVEVTSAQGCTNSATQVINIVAGLQALNYSVDVSCDPYSVEVTVLPTPFSNDITYNWSNGESTQTITVSDGGAYRVTVTLGGCSYTLEVDVPKNPEDYIWIFPTGCYTDCSTELNYLVGPTLPLNYWGWNLDGNADSSGSGTFASPYTLIKDGVYTLTIDTGDCKIESAPLDYSTTKCDKCNIREVFVKQVVPNDTPYCSYTFNLVLYSGYTIPYQATLTDDLGNVLVLPSTFTIQPGMNNLQFTVIPQSPFNGGTTHWTIQGTLPNGEVNKDCVYEFNVTVPSCQETSSKTGTTQEKELENKTLVQQDLTLYPNPAKDMVTLRYNLSSSNATVEIYDIAGRNISTNVLSSSVGNLEITTSSYPSGIYIVVVKQDGAILAQKKLIIE